jgi:signal transduction histidine kinase/CheY-like chemotaxis protein
MNSLLANFIGQLGFVLLERHGDGLFSLVSKPPGWFGQIWVINTSDNRFTITDLSPFLDNFLIDAEAFWNGAQNGACESGAWIETTHSGEQIVLEARALRLDDRQILTIFSPEIQYEDKVRVLQTARNSLLQHEKLMREIQKKEILLHCIVHDLSQPLSAMRGSFDCLATENNPKNAIKFIELGRHASDQQESMIREILNAFAADLQADLNAERTVSAAPDLLFSAKEAASTLAPAFSAKGVRLVMNDKNFARMNCKVQGEQTRLRRIFTNLLENALRYTPPNSSVTIGIEDEGPFLKAYVDDEGPGLPVDLRPAEMFALFGKGQTNGGKAGLGLYFCRVTVERWGGSIGCSSLAKIGSRFWFRLPKPHLNGANEEKKRPERLTDETKRMNQQDIPGRRILLADDQDDIRLLSTHQLERGGHKVVAVANGQAAYEAVQKENFDIIFLDEEMPILNGVETVRAIREFQKTKGVRNIIIAFTGNNTAEDRTRLVAAGFDGVVGKPFRLGSLDSFLLDLGDANNLRTLGDERSLNYSETLEGLLHRVGGDRKLLRQMISTFLRETPKRLETIEKAIRRKNSVDLSSCAHALKGSLGIFAATEAFQHSQSLQELGRASEFEESRRIFRLLLEEIAKLQQNLRGYAKEIVAGSSARSKEVRAHVKEAKKRKR